MYNIFILVHITVILTFEFLTKALETKLFLRLLNRDFKNYKPDIQNYFLIKNNSYVHKNGFGKEVLLKNNNIYHIHS